MDYSIASTVPLKASTVLAVISLVFYAICKILYGALFGPLSSVPGLFLARVSTIQITLAGIAGNRAQTLLRLHRKYGPVVRIGPNEVSISDWRQYRSIYNNPKAAIKQPAFYALATFVGKDNIFSMINVEQHLARRKLSAAPYSLQSMTALQPLIQEKAKKLVDRLITYSRANAGGSANAFELCGLYTFEVVCHAGFAMDFSQSEDTESLILLKAMDGSALTLIFDSAMPWLRSTGLATRVPGPIGAVYRSFEYWELKSREMVDHFLQNHDENTRYLLTPYLKGNDSFLSRSLSREEFVEEAMGLMFAGSGTTSTTLTYLLYALSRPKQRELQKNLRIELSGIATDNISGLRELPLLNAIIKETMRLYPTIISTLPRVLQVPLDVGYMLPPGTVVGMQNLVHHRDPSVFPDPDRFVAERWLKPTPDMEAALTPFSLGRRNCIGQNLAWEELYVACSEIFRRVELRLSPETTEQDMEFEDRFNLAPRGKKLMLQITELNDSL